jgi:hypothetical protein
MDFFGSSEGVKAAINASYAKIQRSGEEAQIPQTIQSRIPRHTAANPSSGRRQSIKGQTLSPYHIGSASAKKTAEAATANEAFAVKGKKRKRFDFGMTEMKQALRAKGVMERLSPRRKAAARHLKQTVKSITVESQEKINEESGAMSELFSAKVELEEQPGEIEAVCLMLRDSSEEIQFMPEEAMQKIERLEKAIGSHAPVVYQIDIDETSARPRVIMELLEKIPDLDAKERAAIAKEFIHVFGSMQKAELIHGDLKGVNVMCRRDKPTSPVLIDLLGVHTLKRYKSIRNADELLKEIAEYDEGTGPFNPPDTYPRLKDLKQRAEGVILVADEVNRKNEEGLDITEDFGKLKSMFAPIKNDFIDLVVEKEKCNAACAVYELLWGIESVPGVKDEGYVQKKLDLAAIKDKIAAEPDLPKDIQSFLLKNFNI